MNRKYTDLGRILNDKSLMAKRAECVLLVRSYAKGEGFGEYKGYVKGNKVTLIPTNARTRERIGKKEISVFDLQPKEDGGMAYER